MSNNNKRLDFDAQVFARFIKANKQYFCDEKEKVEIVNIQKVGKTAFGTVKDKFINAQTIVTIDIRGANRKERVDYIISPYSAIYYETRKEANFYTAWQVAVAKDWLTSHPCSNYRENLQVYLENALDMRHRLENVNKDETEQKKVGFFGKLAENKGIKDELKHFDKAYKEITKTSYETAFQEANAQASR